MTKDPLDKLKIVSFLSFQFTEVQQRYHTTERETLAVIRCLAECRWLVNSPQLGYISPAEDKAPVTNLTTDMLSSSEVLENHRVLVS